MIQILLSQIAICVKSLKDDWEYWVILAIFLFFCGIGWYAVALLLQ